MEQPSPSGAPRPDSPDTAAAEPELQVTCTRGEGSAEIRVVGELTEDARRPLVRTLTDLMLSGTALQRLQLDLRGVSFLNSAGIAALVQLQKMAQPRGIEIVLVVATSAVVQPLQLSGLWHRMTIVDKREPA
jgi:anti-anti-sigma factor